jgi:hypothetical protein
MGRKAEVIVRGKIDEIAARDAEGRGVAPFGRLEAAQQPRGFNALQFLTAVLVEQRVHEEEEARS